MDVLTKIKNLKADKKLLTISKQNHSIRNKF